jgi:hypothetical protein
MKPHTFFKPESDRVETGLWAVIVIVVLLAIALAAMPAVAPPGQHSPSTASPPAALVTQISAESGQGRFQQLIADLRTLVAALRYLMEAETDPATIA